jgi:hypothetical protein
MFTSKPVLVLPDMSKQFWVKCDASDYAVGGVLLQESPEDGYLHPICYMSKALSGSELNWTVFDKEMYALIVVFKLWRQFLQSPHHPVRVLSDHLNLTHWVTMDIRYSRRLVRWAELLSEYNFTITHIAGVKNVEADALSRRPDHEEAMTVIKGGDGLEEVYLLKPMHFNIIRKITVKPDHYIIKKIAGLTKSDDFARKILLEPRKHWKILKLNDTTQVLTFNGLIYVPNNRKIKRLILQSRHDAPYAGHLGRRKTLASVSRDYYWPGMMKYVIEYTKSCDLCQRNRIDTHRPFGKLQPLPVPKGPWREIGYDMVGPLPESEGYNAIMTIVDRLTKQAHFIPCRTNLDTPDCAKLFMKEIWRLHGTPTKVISDRGPIFNSKFMHELYKGLGIQARYSTAYHPQTDGQAERTNQIAEQYLRKYVNEEQTNWAELLPLAEFAYNSAEQESIHMSPFQAIYGYQPKFSPKDEFVQTVPAVKQRLKNIKRGFEVIKKAIREAQAKQKEHYDKKRKEAPVFKVGDWVLIRQDNLTTVRSSQKLDHRKAGPFKIIKITGKNTVRLKFSERMKGLHSNINVRLLELYHPDTIEGRTKPPPPPVVISQDNIEYELEKIITHRINKDKNKTVNYLVSWKGMGPADEQWMTLKDLKNAPEVLETYHKRFPQLKPKTKTKPKAKASPKPISEDEDLSKGEAVAKGGDGVTDENLDPNAQYRKTYEGPDLIHPNLEKTHTMATRSNRSPRVVIRRARLRRLYQPRGADKIRASLGKGPAQESADTLKNSGSNGPCSLDCSQLTSFIGQSQQMPDSAQ